MGKEVSIMAKVIAGVIMTCFAAGVISVVSQTFANTRDIAVLQANMLTIGKSLEKIEKNSDYQTEKLNLILYGKYKK